MKNRIIIIFILSICFSICSSSAYALGIGAYGSFGGGETYYGTLTLNGETHYAILENRTPNIYGGGGLVIDTNCAGNRLFNYRLTAGVDALFSKRPMVEKMYRVSIANNFGFGIVRTDLVRLWMGPQLGVFFLKGNNRYPIRLMLLSYSEKLEQSMVGLGLGLALGVNFNLGEHVTVSFEGGLRYIIYYGVQATDLIIEEPMSFSGIYYVPYTYSTWTLSSGYEGYAGVSVLYRVRDTFTANQDKRDIQ